MAPPSSSSNPPPPPPAPTTTTALTKRSRDTALMPPPPQQPPAKRIKRPPKILDEDTYTGTLDHIVARDFYPGLLEMRAQREYLAAVDSNDKAWQRDAGRNLERIMTPGPDGRRRFGRRGVSMTPVATTPRLVGRAGETPRGWGGETPRTPATVRGGKEEAEEERLAREEEERREREHEEMRGLSLNAFQAKYTSEDNESFNALLDRQNAKRAEKYAFLWQGNKIATGRQIAWREREAKLLKAEEEDKEGGGAGHILNNDRALVRRDPERERDADTRKAMPDHRPAAPRNSLMFAPDSIEDTHETVAQAAQAASTAPPKAIIYNNTRLPAPTTSSTDPENSVPPSPSLSAVNDAIRGRPRPTDSEVGSAAAYSGSETPRVNGYAFVDEDDDDPEPEPDHSLLQRLGITAGDDGGRPNPFSIRQASRREELHHRLVDKSAKAKREGAASGGGGGMGRIAALKGEASGGKTPTPKFASSPVIARKAGGGAGSLTPAAQRLFARVGGTPKRDGLAGFAAFGGSGRGGTPLTRENRERVRWTPTPKVKRSMG